MGFVLTAWGSLLDPDLTGKCCAEHWLDTHVQYGYKPTDPGSITGSPGDFCWRVSRVTHYQDTTRQ